MELYYYVLFLRTSVAVVWSHWATDEASLDPPSAAVQLTLIKLNQLTCLAEALRSILLRWPYGVRIRSTEYSTVQTLLIYTC